jgi:hypothetical protein
VLIFGFAVNGPSTCVEPCALAAAANCVGWTTQVSIFKALRICEVACVTVP